MLAVALKEVDLDKQFSVHKMIHRDQYEAYLKRASYHLQATVVYSV